jgi:hypothetical protein
MYGPGRSQTASTPSQAEYAGSIPVIGSTKPQVSGFLRLPDDLGVHCGRLGNLLGPTVVYTGHGEATTVGDEVVQYDESVARGH